MIVEEFIKITSNGPASPLRGSIAGIMGSTSLACWIVLLMPQLIEQWRLKSADGIAIGFILIWFLGDLFNLIGAIWAGLLPQVIFLAVWFCVTDFLMIFSYFYYTHLQKTKPVKPVNDEETPLVENRRPSSVLTDIALEPKYHGVFIKFVLPILFVIGCGTLGYFVSDNGTPDNSDGADTEIKMGPQIVGYCSALLYLGARIPQIIQNHKRKSVHGLSLLFFLFSTLGNLTYAAQILCYRNDWNYIVLNMSWLLGSLGTIFEDSVIFMQFYIYKDEEFTP